MRLPFAFAALLAALLAAIPALRAADTSRVMRYKMVAVDPEPWIDPRHSADVAALIDQIVADGFDTIGIGSYKFMPMEFVDYSTTPYPEASEFTPAKIAANVATLRANIRLAKSKGIKRFISRSYSFYAPYRFWKAHQAELNPGGLFTPLLEKAHQNDIYLKTLAGKDRIIPQQQWNNPFWRDFFLDSTARMLDALPELDGFLNAYAEAAWTYQPEVLRANRWTDWKQAVDYPATHANFVDYTNRLYALLVSKRGDRAFFGLRDWYITPADLKPIHVPKDRLVVAVKYAGFDEPLINYPPWAKTLLDGGVGVVLDLHEYDAEHPHPIYWYSRDILFRTFQNIYAGGFDGIMYQGFAGKGAEAKDPIRLLTNRTLGAAMNRQPFSEGDAVAFLRPSYGDGAADLLQSLEHVAFAQAELIKLCPAWFWQGDGLTAGGPQTLSFWMLMDNPDAPPGMAFVRQDVESVMDYLHSGAQPGQKTPLDVIQEMDAAADQAVAAILRARAKAPAHAPFLQDIVASAYLHREMVSRDIAFIRAALAFYASGAHYDGKYNKDETLPPPVHDERAACLAQLKEIVHHDELLRALELDYAPRRPKTRQRQDYAFEKRIAKIIGAELPIPPLDHAAFDRDRDVILNRAGR